MPSYRLLRSNQESGPYSLNDLVTLGLKPYDLIWVDGRSAAWRYPSEVSELKEYAPAIEEQPYDRFFKKTSDSETSSTGSTIPPEQNIVSKKQTINESLKKETSYNTLKESDGESEDVQKLTPEVPNPAPSSYPPQPGKKVFVSMPETTGPDPFRDPYDNGKYEQYLPKSTPVQAQQNQMQAEQESYSPINIRESDESKLKTKYTQSLDDIKEMYLNTLVQRKTKNRRKEIFKKYLRPALVPLFLLTAGVAIGYIITNKKNSLHSQSVTTVVPRQDTADEKDTLVTVNNDNDNDNKNQQPEESQGLVPGTEGKKATSSNRQEQIAKTTEDQEKNTASLDKGPIPEKKEKASFIPDREIVTIAKKNVEVDPTTGERKKVVRDSEYGLTAVENPGAGKSERPVKKNNSEPLFLDSDDHGDIRNLVSVKSNEYLRGAFGGIRGLELTVYNNSNYLIDEVSVELQIMKPSEQPLRTDIITFRNIAANKAVTVKVPDSQRGIRVDYHITNVESKQWQKSTAGL